MDKDVVYCIGGRGTGGCLAVRVGGRGDVTDTHRVWVGTKGSNVSSPCLHEGHLYWAHESSGIVYCAELATGNIVYEERLPRPGPFYASPVLADGKIYYLTRNGRTFVVAAKPQFELLATNDFGERSTFNASPVVADGRLFIRSDKTLYCLDQ
jgi:outer membrane protein assembly factor BamB